MKVLLILLLAPPAVFAGLLALAAFWKRCYRRELSCHQTHFVSTADGWRLALHRWVPRNPREGSRHVLICHGLGGNAKNFDLSERQSLPLFLNEAGYEVWIVELRGAGMSSRPSPWGRFRNDYDFDDYLEQDLPAAIGYVRNLAGEPVYYVGHSMGGMLAYALLQTEMAAAIRACVILASPAKLDHLYLPRLWRFREVMKLVPSFLFGTLSEAAAPLFERSTALQRAIGFNRENLYPGDATAISANNHDNIPMRLIMQFGRWAASDAETGGDGEAAYKTNLERIAAPMLFLVGAGDLTAPVEAVRHAYDRVGSRDKRFIVAGRESGFRADYGHVDLVLGRYAREEVYPLIADWLGGH